MNYNYDENIIKNSYSEASKIEEINYDLDLYRLVALNNIINYIFQSNTIWNYTLNNKNQFSRIIIKDINKIKIYSTYKTIYNNINDFIIHICFDCNSFNNITIQTFFNNGGNYNIEGDEINLINNYYKNILNNIYLMIKNSDIIDNYFYECFQIKTGDIYGYYKFDRIEIDCGKKTNTFSYPRVIKAKIKYHKIIIKELNNLIPENNTIFIDRKIIIALIQVFTRCYFENRITNGRYIGTSNNSIYDFNINNFGKFINLDRNKIVKDFYEEIPSDTNDLINKFYQLGYEKQNVFLSACEMYIDGIKHYSSKSLSIFVFALESLANYEFKSSKISKKVRIYKLIKNLYGKEMYSQEFINYIYNLRCMYSHEAISNNQLKQNIFNFSKIDEDLILEIEALTYSVLIKWLERA